MPIADIAGIDLCFETHGDPEGEPLLLIMGFTAQLTSWPQGFVDALVDRGFHVIRFDNRDSGLSAKTAGDPPDVVGLLDRAAKGENVSSEASYTLSDMASDAMGLLDHLGIATAHVAGASMGGMIVQHLAVEHPTRLRSVTSIMSTTGDTDIGAADPAVMAALLTPAPTDPEEAVAHGVEVNRLIAGPLWNRAEAEIRTRSNLERSTYPAGAAFQLAAIAASGDRTKQLGSVSVPFLVIHGEADRLIDVSGGLATAQAVPGADLLVLAAMGHDLPPPLWPQVADAISGIALRPPLAP